MKQMIAAALRDGSALSPSENERDTGNTKPDSGSSSRAANRAPSAKSPLARALGCHLPCQIAKAHLCA